jgi:hypothetical protein
MNHSLSNNSLKRSLCLLLACICLNLSIVRIKAQTEPLGGQPSIGSMPSVPDLESQVAYQRAFEAIVWAMPASAMHRFRMGLLDQPGMADNVINSYSGPLLPHTEVITGNTVTPYIAATSDLRSGPIVLEIPAKDDQASIYGQILNAWQVTIADVGPGGADKGAGGKYLLLPPDYDQPIPDGYIPVASATYRIAFVFRSVAAPNATQAEAYAYTKQLKMYPLTEAADPKPTRFVDGRSEPLFTMPYYDIRALQDIHDVINVEPVQPRDQVMIGMLATIGIEKGKPFAPEGKLKEAMERGVRDAYFYKQQLVEKMHNANMYWPDRHWSYVMSPDDNDGFAFVTHDAVEIDRRAAAWTFFTFYPRVMKMGQTPVVYLAPMADQSGRPLESGKNYRVRVPKDVPARQFWSLTMYDNATWTFIKNPLDRSGLASTQKEQLKFNSDGSVDLYFGPDAPKDFESNWLPTMGKKPYLWFRIYAPSEAFWDKSFKLPDVELIQ